MAEDEGRHAGGIAGTFTRKLGPLPAWAWIVVGAGVGFVFLRMRKGASVQSTPGQSDLLYGRAPGAGGLIGTGSGAGGFVDSGQTPVNPVGNPQPVTPPPPSGVPAPVLLPVKLGDTFLNWTQSSLDQFMGQLQSIPNFPWQFAGVQGGTYTFIPKNTRQPLPAVSGPAPQGGVFQWPGRGGSGSQTQSSVAGNLVPTQNFGGAYLPATGSYLPANPGVYAQTTGTVPGGYAYRMVNGVLRYLPVQR